MGLELGKQSEYDVTYNPDRLFALPRAEKWREIGVDPNHLPFVGYDIWNHYEVSWLNSRGKPMVAIAVIQYDCASPNIIESKALKLYFNSFNNTQYATSQELAQVIQSDLEQRILSAVMVEIIPLADVKTATLEAHLPGESIDDLDVTCSVYTVQPDYLTTADEIVTETLYSNLLKSNCLITNQPDWASVQISYSGKKIDRAGLLRYLVSFRNHNEFHEQCIERIYMDLKNHCHPSELMVYGRYTRRGGLDINPLRASSVEMLQRVEQVRLVRQ